MKTISLPFKIKKDKYQKKGGGFSKILVLFCKNCKNKIGYYQKDGNGWLKRCYVDRLYMLPNLIHPYFSLKTSFICSNCGLILGKPLIYQKENREAFEINRKNLIRKKLIKI